MKNRVLIPLVIFLFSTSSAWAQNNEETPRNFFISHEQFLSLTNSEQKTYVKKLREMITEMGETFPYFAEEMSARSSLFQQLWFMGVSEAFSEDIEGYSDSQIQNGVTRSIENALKYYKAVNSGKFSELSVQEKSESVEKYRQSLYWVSVAATQAHHIRDPQIRKSTLDGVVAQAAKTVQSNEDKIKTIADESEISFARDEILKKSLAGKGTVTASFPAPGLTYYGEKLEAPPQSPPAPAKKMVEAKPESAKGKSAEQKPPSPPKVVSPKAAIVPKTPPMAEPAANAHYYRCMYAGFIIKKDPCIAPRELPWKLQGLDNSFACAQGTVMCNPFVFGFNSKCDWMTALEKNKTDTCWSTAKPYCVKPGLYATKNCMSISTNENSLQAAVELIKKNVSTYNQLGESFADLCFKGLIDFNSYPRKRTAQNTQRTKDDIKKTCEVASTRMKDIEKRYGLTKGADKSAAQSGGKPQETKGQK